ncbi:uncharacterized protein EMH_0070050 [Eimeria mitis]|uniref:Uncharacterized protein n=1 Tax=Eimeria mitis TaxID=44415 RepID=U6K270_9EIME|nr:uncharacterized protein EMH_0070050 [Eimeria mitis]CDJ31819.1 hypothetical protein EMH_0070050 [Eimeria mitis]
MLRQHTADPAEAEKTPLRSGDPIESQESNIQVSASPVSVQGLAGGVKEKLKTFESKQSSVAFIPVFQQQADPAAPTAAAAIASVFVFFALVSAAAAVTSTPKPLDGTTQAPSSRTILRHKHPGVHSTGSTASISEKKLRELEGVLRHREDLIRSLEGAVAQRESDLSFVLKEKFQLSKAIVASRVSSSGAAATSSSNGISNPATPSPKPGGVSFCLPAVHAENTPQGSSADCNRKPKTVYLCTKDSKTNEEETAKQRSNGSSADEEVTGSQPTADVSLEGPQQSEIQLSSANETTQEKRITAAGMKEAPMQPAASVADLHTSQSTGDGVSRRVRHQQPPTASEVNPVANKTNETEPEVLETGVTPVDATAEDSGGLQGHSETRPAGSSKALLADAAAYLGSNGWRLSRNCRLKPAGNADGSASTRVPGPVASASTDSEPQSLSEQQSKERSSDDGEDVEDRCSEIPVSEERENGVKEEENGISGIQPIDAGDTQSGSKVGLASQQRLRISQVQTQAMIDAEAETSDVLEMQDELSSKIDILQSAFEEVTAANNHQRTTITPLYFQ